MDLPGVGRWTAEMFLIFELKPLDVLSPGDAGLQRAAKLLVCQYPGYDGLAEAHRRCLEPLPVGSVVVSLATSCRYRLIA
jgi:3-methyladenine DNA glycosylase/8-oxoguanine DNA glycosylase